MLSQALLLSSLLLTAFSQVLKNEDYRLPHDVDPISYKLTLNPHIDSLKFTGNLTFTFRPLKNLRTLILNSKDLLIHPEHSFIGDETGNTIEISEVLENRDLERILIKPSKYFAKGRIYAVNFNYEGNITEDGSGLYRSSYVDNGKKEWMLVSQMRPVHARKVFPCLDEPSFRSKFKLSVWHPPEYRVISNMPVVVTEILGHRALTEFEETPSIPVFLTGLLISKLGSVSGKRGFESLAVPEEVPAVAYSAEIGPKVATAMEKLLGLAYPQTKTHQVALPRLVPVAMENWGLFNFRKENILYSPKSSPTVQKQTAARFSAHEVVHTWIGNSVTLAWWDYLWLSEMFAMYLEYYLPHLVEPGWRMDEQLAVDLAFSGLAGDSPQADPLTTRVLTPQQVSAKFSGLTYTKGPGLLRMVQNVLTLPNFFRGIKTYVETYWEQSVTPAQLWQTLEAEGTFPASLEVLMHQWTEEPGYPLVKVALSGGSVVFTQEPFSVDGSGSSNGSWWIPVSTLTSDDIYADTRPKFWLPPGQALQVPIQGEWLMANVDGTGFFRTSYDPELFSRLSNQLANDHNRLPPLSRAILIDDAVWLSRSGLLDIKAALGLINYLSAEVDFIVWKSAATSLDLLDSLLLHTKVYPLFKSYIASLVNNVFSARGLSDTPVDSTADRVQRQIVTQLACKVGEPSCVRGALSLVAEVVAGVERRISPDVEATVYCTAVAEGGSAIWQYVLSSYLNSPKDGARYLPALACTNDYQAMKSFLIDSIPDLEVADWTTRVSAFASRKENSENLLNIIHENINVIINKYGPKTVSSVLLQFTKYLTTKKQINVLEDIERLGVGGLSAEIPQIETRRVWRQKNVPKILSYLRSNFQFALITW